MTFDPVRYFIILIWAKDVTQHELYSCMAANQQSGRFVVDAARKLAAVAYTSPP